MTLVRTVSHWTPNVMSRCLRASLIAAACLNAFFPFPSEAQAPVPPTRPAKGGVLTAPPSQKIEGNLLQVMRGILYPASNVIFAAQGETIPRR